MHEQRNQWDICSQDRQDGWRTHADPWENSKYDEKTEAWLHFVNQIAL